MLLCFFLFVLSVPSTEALGTISFFLGFFAIVPVTVDLLRSSSFLVFVVGLLYFFIVETYEFSLPFSPFFPTTVIDQTILLVPTRLILLLCNSAS
jgi:hypothetical protein